DAESLVGLALPGSDELAALLRLATLARSDGPPRLVVDSAPTGHTLRLLALPRLAARWTAALARLEERPDAVARAFGGTVSGGDDEAHRLVQALRDDVALVSDRLADPAHTCVVLVTTPEPAVAAETGRYADALEPLGVALGALVVNRVRDDTAGWTPRSVAVPVVHVPELAHEPRGVPALRALARTPAPRAEAPAGPSVGTAGRLRVGEPWAPPLDRRLCLVVGKGGVGKSTVASGLALRLAEAREGRVLLLGVDPAGSLGDVWGAAVEGEPVAAPGAPGVVLRQLQAEVAWSALRERYRDGAGRLVGAITGGDAASRADRGLAAQLVELAPPGLDELAALLELVDLPTSGSYTAVVLDTAPTGHLLRLLELPALALDWSHLVLRLLLRYREVVGLGELAERVLGFARDVRRLEATLRDRTATLVLVVARPEALGVPETGRLLARLAELGMAADVLLVNQLTAGEPPGIASPDAAGLAAELLALPHAPAAVAAPLLDAGPHGADALRRFARSWRRLTLHPEPPATS
ncbi:MAG TPA: ArsA-related P-loop ATPase, partial [Gemmatimonadaceae bacterium]